MSHPFTYLQDGNSSDLFRDEGSGVVLSCGDEEEGGNGLEEHMRERIMGEEAVEEVESGRGTLTNESDGEKKLSAAEEQVEVWEGATLTKESNGEKDTDEQDPDIHRYVR